MVSYTVSVRSLQPADADAYRALRLMGLQECPTAFSASHEEELRLPAAQWGFRLQPAPEGFVLGAFAADQLIGTVTLVRETRRKLRHKGAVVAMYVHPDHRDRGIGRGLMHVLLERVKQLDGVEQLVLAVSADNAAAKGLYAAYGFQAFGRENHALKIDGKYHDEDYMILFLQSEGL